jgi:hypothetical protein
MFGVGHAERQAGHLANLTSFFNESREQTHHKSDVELARDLASSLLQSLLPELGWARATINVCRLLRTLAAAFGHVVQWLLLTAQPCEIMNSPRNEIKLIRIQQIPNCGAWGVRLDVPHPSNGPKVRSAFSWDHLLSIAACILNGQSPRCYSQYENIVCSVGTKGSFYSLHS